MKGATIFDECLPAQRIFLLLCRKFGGRFGLLKPGARRLAFTWLPTYRRLFVQVWCGIMVDCFEENSSELLLDGDNLFPKVDPPGKFRDWPAVFTEPFFIEIFWPDYAVMRVYRPFLISIRNRLRPGVILELETDFSVIRLLSNGGDVEVIEATRKE